MSATQYDVTIEQGSSFIFSFTHKSGSNPVDLTDYCARLVWLTNNNIITEFLTTNNDPSLYSFTLGNDGILTLKIPASVTNDFDFLTAQYDLEIQSDDNFYTGGGKLTERIAYGTVTLEKRHSLSNNLLDCQ